MLQANKACVSEQCSSSQFLLALLFHEFGLGRFCFYCEKKVISDQRLLTASGRRVICEHLISSCGSRRMARFYLWQRKASHSNTHINRRVQTHDGGGSRTLQTSVLQTRLRLHMPLTHVPSLWSVYLQGMFRETWKEDEAQILISSANVLVKKKRLVHL